MSERNRNAHEDGENNRKDKVPRRRLLGLHINEASFEAETGRGQMRIYVTSALKIEADTIDGDRNRNSSTDTAQSGKSIEGAKLG